MGDPQVTIGFNTKLVIHDLDDFGPHDFGNLNMYSIWHRWSMILLEELGTGW